MFNASAYGGAAIKYLKMQTSISSPAVDPIR
jgi:hypothetical protein